LGPLKQRWIVDQHGQSRPRPGQRVYRALVAVCEVRLLYPGDFATGLDVFAAEGAVSGSLKTQAGVGGDAGLEAGKDVCRE